MSRVAYVWAIAGIAAIFVEAIVQLGRRAISTVAGGLEPLEWLAFVLIAAAFVYGEGVRALGRRWVPNVVARARTLRPDTPHAYRILAPLYAMFLVGAPARTLARAWIGVVLIVAAVLIVRAMPYPWRGIVDGAVALALLWGVLVLLRLSLGRGGGDVGGGRGGAGAGRGGDVGGSPGVGARGTG